MKNIERAKGLLYYCDYYGYCKGRTYYINRTKNSDGNYVAQQDYNRDDTLRAFTLKELSAKLSQHTPIVKVTA